MRYLLNGETLRCSDWLKRFAGTKAEEEPVNGPEGHVKWLWSTCNSNAQ